MGMLFRMFAPSVMLKRIASLGASAAAVVALAASSAGTPVALAKTCPSGFTHATINGSQKCLHAGEYCSHRYERQYLHYHYTCEVVRGVYRLERS